jgi:hypothetical protein
MVGERGWCVDCGVDQLLERDAGGQIVFKAPNSEFSCGVGVVQT